MYDHSDEQLRKFNVYLCLRLSLFFDAKYRMTLKTQNKKQNTDFRACIIRKWLETQR